MIFLPPNLKYISYTMKQILHILIFFITSLIFGQKQHTMLKAGVNFANLNSESDSFTARISFHAGFGIESELNNHLSLEPEILFSSQGAKVKKRSNVVNSLNYVNLPVMLRYYPDGGFFMEIGPQVGILVSAKQRSDSQYDEDINNLKGQDYGLNLGIGFKSQGSVGINARYYLGLRDINDYEFGENLKNSVFQISLNIYLN